MYLTEIHCSHSSAFDHVFLSHSTVIFKLHPYYITNILQNICTPSIYFLGWCSGFLIDWLCIFYLMILKEVKKTHKSKKEQDDRRVNLVIVLQWRSLNWVNFPSHIGTIHLNGRHRERMQYIWLCNPTKKPFLKRKLCLHLKNGNCLPDH